MKIQKMLKINYLVYLMYIRWHLESVVKLFTIRNSAYIFSLLFLCECSIQGTYRSSYLPDYEEIHLNPENKVYYFISMDIMGKYSLHGNWKVVKDTLYIYFDKPIIDRSKDSIMIKNDSIFPKNKKKISIKNWKNDAIIGIEVGINNLIQKYVSDLNGEIEITTNDIIRDITLLGYFGGSIELSFSLQNTEGNYFEIITNKFEGDDFILGIPTDKWIFKRGKIYRMIDSTFSQPFKKRK